MKIRLSFIFFITIIIFVIFVFFKSLFENKNYVPKNINNKIENISIKEFYSDNKLELKKLFDNEKFIIINIWSSWCVPCRVEHAFLMDLGKEKNLKLVGLNYKDNVMNAKNFLSELNNPYEIILTDNNGLVAIEWGAYGVPETFLIHKKKIIKKIVGPLNSDLTFDIRELIKK